MALSVTIDSVDVSSSVIGCRATETVEGGQISTATITLVDESQSITVENTDAVVISLDATTLWKGEVSGPPQLRRIGDDTMVEVVRCEGYGKLLHESVVPETEFVQSWPIVTAETSPDRFRIEGDYSSEFNNGDTFLVRDSTANDDTWTVDTGTYDAGTNRTEIAVQESDVSGEDDGVIIEIKADDAVISDLMDYVDIDDDSSSDIDSSTHVSQVLSQFEHGLTLGPCTVAEAMEKIAEISGARWWVDMDKALHYSDSVSAETDSLSEDPGDVGGTVYRGWELEVASDQTFTNRVLVVGKAPDGTVISKWVDDATSQTTYGDRESVLIDATLNTTDGLEAAGQRIIDANKDPNVTATILTMQDGFEAGKEVDISSDAYGYTTETFFIRAVEMRFVRRDGADDVEYKLYLGDPQWDATAAHANTERRIRRLENTNVGTTASGGGGSGASSSAEYLTLSLTSALSAERQFTAGDGLDGTDDGANSSYTVAVDVTDIIDTDYGLTEDTNNIRVNIGDGLEFDTGVLEVDLSGTSGLEFSSADLQIADSIAGDGLTISSKVLAVGAGTGITVNADDIEVTQEQIEDWAGAMFSGNTETFITATYQDADGTVDLIVPVKDEDDMASDSDTFLATQQSIKKYVDDQVGGVSSLSELDDVTITGPADNDLLQYDNGSSKWVDRTLAEAGVASTAHHDTHDPQDGSDALDCAAAGAISPDDSAAEGTAHSFARSDHVHEITCDAAAEISTVTAAGEGSASYFARSDHVHAISHSIDDNHIVTMDDADAAADDWARFTANGLAGYSDSEVLAALSGDAGAAFSFNDQDITNVGDIALDSISADAGDSFNVSADVLPATNDTYDLGSSSYMYATAWISEMNAVLFVENSIQVTGGWWLIPHASGTLGADLADTDDTCDFGTAMTEGDFVIMQASGQVEYFEVGANTAGNVYKIGADGSGARNLDGSGANDWPQGTVFAVLGQSANNDGWIRFDAQSATGTPNITIYEQGATYNAQTEVFRAGNLNGAYGYAAATWGVGMGEYSEADYFTIDGTSGLRFLDSDDTVQGQLSSGAWTLGEVAASKSNVYITAGAVQLRTNETVKIELNTDGDAILGEVATDHANMFWDSSEGKLNFRGGTDGTAVEAYIDTDGSITAGGGSVVLDSDGVTLAQADAAASQIKWKTGGTTTATIHSYVSGIVDYLHVSSLEATAGEAVGTALYTLNSADSKSATVYAYYDGSDSQIQFFIDGGTYHSRISANGLEMADGAEATPGYTFTDDGNTGLYRIGADNIGVSANGSKVLDIGTGGLGITGSLSISSVAAAGTDTDKFLVLDGSNNVDYRAGDDVLSDLGLDSNLKDLTATEITELEAIGDTTISSDQWGYLGSTDQALATTDDVTFNSVTATTSISGWLPMVVHGQLPSTAISDMFANTNTVLFRAVIPRTLTIEDFHIMVYVLGTNDGSNYWTLTLEEIDGTDITTVNTSGAGTNCEAQLSSTGISASKGTGDKAVQVIVSGKTGSPTNFYAYAPALYVQ